MNKFSKFIFDRKPKWSLGKLLLLVLISFVLLWYFSEKYSERIDDNYSANQIQKNLIEKTEALKLIFEKIDLEVQEISLSFETLGAIKNELGCELFFVKGDSIKYWTTNLISVENIDIEGYPVIKLNNGWYKSVFSKHNEYTLIGLIPIKSEYYYNNEFLVESFNSDFRVNSYYEILLEQDDYNIWDKNGEFLFSILRNDNEHIVKNQAYILFVLFHVFLFLILIVIKKLYEKFAASIKPKWLFPLFLIADIFIIWILINYIKSPRILFDSFLYSPAIFADQLHNSIASYFTTVALILFAIYVLFTKRALLDVVVTKSNITRAIMLLIIAVVALFVFETLVVSLFENSQLTFQFGHDFITNPGISVLIFLILCILSLALFFLVHAAVGEINKLKLSPKNYVIFGVIFTAILFVIAYLFSFIFLYISLLFIVLLVSMRLMNTTKLNAIQLVFYLALFSVYMSVLSSIILQEKEIIERQTLAEKLIGTQDVVAESEFIEIENDIYSDSVLREKLQQPLSDSIENIIIQKVERIFSAGAWKKYTAYVTICDSTKVLDIQPEDYLINCTEYFEGFIKDFAEVEISESLVHLKSSTLNNAYIARFNFDSDNNGNPDINIFVELISEFIPEGVGYTELFTDESHEIKGNDIINYSFAKYDGDQLIYKFGSYFYSLGFSKYADLPKGSAVFDYNGYNHLIYQFGENNKLIVSRPQSKFWEKIAPFSYFFILFSLFIMVLTLASNFSLRIFNTPLSFKKRIQVSFTGIILFSFLVIGTITLSYLIDLNNNKNKEILSEKAHSVLVELEHKLAEESSLPVEMTEYLNSLLSKFSLVFFSDINLYDLEGRMIASSRPRIINEGLISPLIHPKAYRVLTKDKKLLFIQNESIGRYNYLSAYLPFRNSENQLIAYLNLPYFARQSEIQKEITTFLVALVNIYLLFFVIAIIITLFISRRMSKPLELIRTSIGQLKLGETNEKINWQRADEIGSLINEYNRMIDELGKSAELLAQSERESAWREMAKQVAHEIKNPLTPMKLSVQYLKKMWDDKTPGWEEHLERFSTTIVQQIDTLSEIASAFSDFAKMPKKKIEAIELTDIIQKSLGLFKEHKNLKIHFKSEVKEYLIEGDKNQVLRVFNNLIKNSIQAVSGMSGGEIFIQLSLQNESCLVSVKDNGIGIPEERAEKIFSPSFTTKTSGMGMGLSIVKSIVLDTGGKIWFESEENIGTTFYIEFPLFNAEKL